MGDQLALPVLQAAKRPPLLRAPLATALRDCGSTAMIALAVYAATAWAAERARTNNGPTLIEHFTYRAEGHSARPMIRAPIAPPMKPRTGRWAIPSRG